MDMDLGTTAPTSKMACSSSGKSVSYINNVNGTQKNRCSHVKDGLR